jgi:hypothetical protein
MYASIDFVLDTYINNVETAAKTKASTETENIIFRTHIFEAGFSYAANNRPVAAKEKVNIALFASILEEIYAESITE